MRRLRPLSMRPRTSRRTDEAPDAAAALAAGGKRGQSDLVSYGGDRDDEGDLRRAQPNDIPAMVKPFDPQIEWTTPAEFPSGGTFRGLAAVEAHLARARATRAEG